MRLKDLTALDEKDVQEKLAEFRKELMKERTQVSIGTQLKNPKKVSILKKDIARIMLILKNKAKKQEGGKKV